MRQSGLQGVRTAAGWLLAAALISTAALGQTPAATLDGSAPQEQIIPTEVLVAPVLKSNPLHYPLQEMRDMGEGWVQLGLMVDPTGKPFEVTVNASSGDKVFERAAVESIEKATFKPGLLNGQPIESATELKIVFKYAYPITGARPEFIDRYEELRRAIKAKDRPRADAAMKHLGVNNLYEDAFFGLASYDYAIEWGDETQQLAGLERAIAYEKTPHYLTRAQLQSVRLTSLALDIKLHHYAEALILWPVIVKSGADAATIDKLRPLVQRVDQLRLKHQPYDVPGLMPDGKWQLRLFEPSFRISVSQGHISEVKLRCSRGYVRFAFDPDIEYRVAGKYGNCNMELDGDPGTSFVLTQL